MKVTVEQLEELLNDHPDLKAKLEKDSPKKRRGLLELTCALIGMCNSYEQVQELVDKLKNEKTLALSLPGLQE